MRGEPRIPQNYCLSALTTFTLQISGKEKSVLELSSENNSTTMPATAVSVAGNNNYMKQFAVNEQGSEDRLKMARHIL